MKRMEIKIEIDVADDVTPLEIEDAIDEAIEDLVETFIAFPDDEDEPELHVTVREVK